MLNLINNNGSNISDILETLYTKSEVDYVISNVDLNTIIPKQKSKQIIYHTATNYYEKVTMDSMICPETD